MIQDREYRVTAVGVVCVAALLVVGAGAVASGPSDTEAVTAVQETTTPEDTSRISIQNLSAPDQIRAGEDFTVSADVSNDEAQSAVRRVVYRIGGVVIDSEIVQIPGNNTTSVAFNVTGNTTSGLATGTFTQGVFTEDAEATANLTITAADETTPEETTPEETPEETTPEETTPEETPEETTPEETTPEETPEETTPEETTPEETTPEETPEETTPEETTPEEAAPVDEETTPEETTPEETTLEETTPEETTPEETPEETTPETRTATVAFEDQTSNGTAVTVQSVNVPEGGFVVIHDTSLLDGNVVGSIVGRSNFLAAGTSENVTIELDEPLNESQRLVAVVYRDSNENQTFDFVTSNRTADGPYTEADSRQAVNAIAQIEVQEGTENATATETA
ncbi:DUF7282 domain-containing protein [Halorussus salinisoli]|uniref:DUF7282 domain-containing protein n=1 Tax=Halorussus salinisoli TaxID=2558242 RepID=UPI002A90E349|nr:hypothetical protein [Halorussus salinisoli]